MISPFYQSHKRVIKIHIFKTNIETKIDLSIIKQIFNSNLNIIKWSIDLEDIDKVLRVESFENLNEKDIITLVKSRKFYIEELD